MLSPHVSSLKCNNQPVTREKHYLMTLPSILSRRLRLCPTRILPSLTDLWCATTEDEEKQEFIQSQPLPQCCCFFNL